jgi:hypothetical protein
MSHVDEGALHAFLDGALDEYPPAEARRIREHVETCAVCGERLAEERKVRDDAHAILGQAAPEVAVPSFEELRAYVRAQRPKTEVSVRAYRLSWAASVVLALGTGWMLRGGDAVSIAPLERAQPAQTFATDAVDDAVEMQAVEPRAVEEPEADAPAFQPPALEVTVDQGARAGAPSTLGRVEPAQTQGPVPQAAPAVSEPLVDARRFDDVATGGAAGVTAPRSPTGALAPAAPPSDTRVAERIDSAARANQAERRVAAQDQVVTSALAADAAAAVARQRTANEETVRDEDSVSLVVPGLEVLDVLPVGDGTTFAGMRALQRLESGDTLEVVHLPEGVDPALLPTLGPGRNQLVRPRGAGWLVMRAPVSERYLEELLQRLEAGR